MVSFIRSCWEMSAGGGSVHHGKDVEPRERVLCQLRGAAGDIVFSSRCESFGWVMKGERVFESHLETVPISRFTKIFWGA